MDKSYRISLCSTREHAPCIDSDDTVNVETVCFLELLNSLIGAAVEVMAYVPFQPYSPEMC